MINYSDLFSYIGHCGDLHGILSRESKFYFDKPSQMFCCENGTDKIPKNGIYIMFEKSEKGHGFDRIVRIGINKGNNGRLEKRLYDHYTGTTEKSALRRLIRDCLQNISKNVTFNKEDLENAISEYIQNNIRFIVIEADDAEMREILEILLISTVSSCIKCGASANWLGKDSPKDKVSKSGLWNVEHIRFQSLNSLLAAMRKLPLKL